MKKYILGLVLIASCSFGPVFADTQETVIFQNVVTVSSETSIYIAGSGSPLTLDDVLFSKSLRRASEVSTYAVNSMVYEEAGYLKKIFCYVYKLKNDVEEVIYVLIKGGPISYFFIEDDFLLFLNAFEDMMKKLPTFEPNQQLFYMDIGGLTLLGGGGTVRVGTIDNPLNQHSNEVLLAKLKEVESKIKELRNGE